VALDSEAIRSAGIGPPAALVPVWSAELLPHARASEEQKVILGVEQC
jgi:hypothetical protein